MRWQCGNCGTYISQGADPNKQNRPCPGCALAPPLITWIPA